MNGVNIVNIVGKENEDAWTFMKQNEGILIACLGVIIVAIVALCLYCRRLRIKKHLSTTNSWKEVMRAEDDSLAM